jgi:hypothetical protein
MAITSNSFENQSLDWQVIDSYSKQSKNEFYLEIFICAKVHLTIVFQICRI